jgi:uncharacterized protein YneF (UPF0154 family)
LNKIKRLVITFVVAFLVVIGIGGTAQAARTDMLDVSDYNNNGQALTTQQLLICVTTMGSKPSRLRLARVRRGMHRQHGLTLVMLIKPDYIRMGIILPAIIRWPPRKPKHATRSNKHKLTV